MRLWQILGFPQNKENRQREIIKILLKNRGIPDQKEQESFFQPKHPSDFTLADLGIVAKEVEKTIARIKKAINQQEFIVIYGDYDADGICATAILWETLYKIYPKVMPYLPHRVKEGYGLSKLGIDNLIKKYQPSLIITVDHGVTAIEEVEYAKRKKIDIVITDHHVLPSCKPKSFALIHTVKLSGAGVAWFLANKISKLLEIKKRISPFFLEEQLALCAIGTVADVLPVLGVNRSIVFYGLEQLKKTQRPGLKALFKEAGLKQKDLNTYHLGYIIGPRLNATGRITHALDSLRLLCTNSPEKASQLALTLGSINRQRQKLTEEALLHAQSFIKQNYGLTLNNQKFLFVYDKSYNQGIIGLVAGRLVEQFYRPVIVLAVGETYAKASARSINGFDIISAIRETAELLVDCGGHAMAAGFTVETLKLNKLKTRLTTIFEKKLPTALLTPQLKIDCEIFFADLTPTFYHQLQKFQPFGFGNPEPVFVTTGLKPLNLKLIGQKNQHLQLILQDASGRKFKAIAFDLASLYNEIKKESLIDIAYTIQQNNWNGTSLELKVKDIKVN